jgi:hypothetical protein
MNHSSNMNMCPRRMNVPTNVGSHVMGYKEYSYNPDIRPQRTIVLDHFPHGEFMSICILTIHMAGNHLQH